MYARLWSRFTLMSQWNSMSLPQFNKHKRETLVHRLQTANKYTDVFHLSPIQMPNKKGLGKPFCGVIIGAAIPMCCTIKCQSVDMHTKRTSVTLSHIRDGCWGDKAADWSKTKQKTNSTWIKLCPRLSESQSSCPLLPVHDYISAPWDLLYCKNLDTIKGNGCEIKSAWMQLELRV